MDSMEVNKAIAAFLIAGIAFFVTGTIGTILVHPKPLERPVLDIALQETAAAAPVAAPVELPPVAPLLVKADVAQGETLSKRLCAQCHTFNEGGRNGVGPNLYGIVGSEHGHVTGFNFSNAIKSKPGPWTYDELNKWLHKPSTYAPGTRMAFAGMANDQQRADVIAYLRTLAQNPVPLPTP